MQQALKLLGTPGRVGGYLVVWGNPAQKDLQGEYFTPDTELGLDWYDQRPVLYHHGLDGMMKAAVIGVIDTLKADSTGVWAEAQLDLRQRYVQTVLKLVEKGILGWSSGSLPHLVDVANDGHIKRWPIVEGSMTPTPAEPRMTGIDTIKSVYTSLGWNSQRLALDTPASEFKWPIKAAEPLTETLKELTAKAGFAMADEDGDPLADAAEPPDDSPTQSESSEGIQMNIRDILMAFVQQLLSAGAQVSEEQVNGAISQIEQAVQSNEQSKAQCNDLMQAGKFVELGALLKPHIEAAMGPILADAKKKTDAIKADVEAAAKSLALSMIGSGGQSQINPMRSPEAAAAKFSPLPTVKPTKYDHMSPEDMSFLAEAMKGYNTNWQPSPTFMREIAGKTVPLVKENKINFGANKTEGERERHVRAVKSIQDWAAVKSDELGYSTQASYGDEWVPDLWSAELWKRARLENIIATLFQVVEMPSDPFELPLEGADPTVYYVPETKNETDMTLAASTNPTPDSKIGTGKVQLQSKKLSLRVGFSEELVEDSIIGVIPQYKAQAQRAILDAIDNLLLNGDTATSGNVNYDGGTPVGNERWMALIGLRRILVDTAANAVDMGNIAPTLAKIREARFTLDPAKAGDIPNLALITGSTVYAKLLSLAEVITVDKYGPNATVLNGEIGKLDGIPVLWSAEQAANASNGKVSNSGGSNTRGSLEIVHRLSYVVGYRRRVRVSVDYLSYYDSYQLTANVRVAFTRQDADSAAVLYNIATS